MMGPLIIRAHPPLMMSKPLAQSLPPDSLPPVLPPLLPPAPPESPHWHDPWYGKTSSSFGTISSKHTIRLHKLPLCLNWVTFMFLYLSHANFPSCESN